nr:caspase family protein [Bacillus toyonensis]
MFFRKWRYFFVSYSGRGGQNRKRNDETDGFDETRCLYDGQFTDDELYSLWHLFKEDVRIIVLSDSCHSGTVTRARFYGLNDLSNIGPINIITYRFMPFAIRGHHTCPST